MNSGCLVVLLVFVSPVLQIYPLLFSSTNIQISNFLKILRVGAELCYADGETQTDGWTEKYDEAICRI